MFLHLVDGSRVPNGMGPLRGQNTKYMGTGCQVVKHYDDTCKFEQPITYFVRTGTYV